MSTTFKHTGSYELNQLSIYEQYFILNFFYHKNLNEKIYTNILFLQILIF